ncbi:MAG: hypothetical protein ACUVRC_10235 [Desulfotomaculales bacterium]
MDAPVAAHHHDSRLNAAQYEPVGRVLQGRAPHGQRTCPEHGGEKDHAQPAAEDQRLHRPLLRPRQQGTGVGQPHLLDAGGEVEHLLNELHGPRVSGRLCRACRVARGHQGNDLAFANFRVPSVLVQNLLDQGPASGADDLEQFFDLPAVGAVALAERGEVVGAAVKQVSPDGIRFLQEMVVQQAGRDHLVELDRQAVDAGEDPGHRNGYEADHERREAEAERDLQQRLPVYSERHRPSPLSRWRRRPGGKSVPAREKESPTFSPAPNCRTAYTCLFG